MYSIGLLCLTTGDIKLRFVYPVQLFTIFSPDIYWVVSFANFYFNTSEMQDWLSVSISCL